MNFSKLTSATLILATTSLFSRLLGLIRDRLLASNFGASGNLDCYFASFRIPDLLFNFLILGALSSAFIPIFTDFLAKNKEEKAWEIASTILNFVVISLIFLGGSVFLLAPYLVILIAPGFDSTRLALTTSLTRIMLLSPLFFGISSIFGGILTSYKKFFAYAIAPIFYNLGIISGILILVPIFGIYGLALGVIFGALLHLLVQLPAVISTGFKFKFCLNLKEPTILKIFYLALPVTLGLIISQLNLTVDTIIGSTLKSGSVAVLNFASNLMSLPMGIIGISFAIPCFPLLAEASALKKNSEFATYFSLTLRRILFFILPATVLMIVFRAQIVRLILGTGKFDWQDTILTLKTLGYFSLGLVGFSTVPLLARGFYAIKDTLTPVKIGFFALIINLIGNLVFSRFLGVAGLALASALAALFNAFALLFILGKIIPELDLTKIFSSGVKYLSVSLLTGILAYWGLFLFDPFFDTHTVLGLFGQTIFAFGFAAIFYLIFSFLLGFKELL